MTATAHLPRTIRNQYRIPHPAIINFSGGRTSAYMLKKIVDAYGGRLPDSVAVIFANTGMERPETLEFVDLCDREWGVEIVWVEYLWDAPHRTRVVDFATASRNGEPYAALIDRKGFVPFLNLRFCSSFLKRDRIDSYARHRLGLKRWHSVIGLRADEQRRVLRNARPPTAARAPAPAPCCRLPTPGSARRTSSTGGSASPLTSAFPPTRETARSAWSRPAPS